MKQVVNNELKVIRQRLSEYSQVLAHNVEIGNTGAVMNFSNEILKLSAQEEVLKKILYVIEPKEAK